MKRSAPPACSCFQEPTWGEEHTRSLSSLVVISYAMNVEMCIQAAAVAGYKYAAVQSAKWCFAGDDISEYSEPGTCDYACAGNPDQVWSQHPGAVARVGCFMFWTSQAGDGKPSPAPTCRFAGVTAPTSSVRSQPTQPQASNYGQY